jgi:hypothetical protein
MNMDSLAKEDADVAAKVKGAKKNTLGKMTFDGDWEAVYGQNGKLPRSVNSPGPAIVCGDLVREPRRKRHGHAGIGTWILGRERQYIH